MLYPTLKTLHLVAMVAWFAGLFYLPRLFVYHAQSDNTGTIETLRTMERRLYRGIMNPSMMAVYIFGFALAAAHPGLLAGNSGWFYLKLGCVVALTFYHASLGRMMRAMQQNPPQRSAVFFRWYNEVPTVALLVVVFLAVFKPF